MSEILYYLKFISLQFIFHLSTYTVPEMLEVFQSGEMFYSTQYMILTN
jgi:hypothetical protein